MIIDLASVGREPKPLQATFEADSIELDDGTRLTVPAVFEGRINRGRDDRIRVAGHISSKAVSECSRCLEPVERPLEIDFEDVFVDEANEPTTDEKELADDELDESFIAEPMLDLGEIVREQLVLATDEAVICKEDCRGFCPKCGENRNLIDCKCGDDEIDPRWAALKNLN
jgi:uncharacterized protein